MFAPAPPGLVVAALVVDALIGDPDTVWRRLPHPVTLFGWLVAALDRGLNRDAAGFAARQAAGVAALLGLTGIAGGCGLALARVADALPCGATLTVLVATVFLAQNSLYRHVARVGAAFAAKGLAGARAAVAMIVGRDPDRLDESGVSGAAVESCAENFSDGVVAPAFWFAVAGLPGLLVYKAVNTADSMIGHRTPRHAAFGWAAARLDDALNLVPARLAALAIALVAPAAEGSVLAALRTAWRDGPRHRSPNAGWPEAAMAAALGVKLGGPRAYHGATTDDPVLNPAGRLPKPADIGRALRCLVAACLLQGLVYTALALAL